MVPFLWQPQLGFSPGSPPLTGIHSVRDGHVHLAFSVDGSDEKIAVCPQSDGDTVRGEMAGDADPQVVRKQVARIFSLDIDGAGFTEVGTRDPVIGELQARNGGLRLVSFYSPYEAGAWALLSQRVQMNQAVRITARLAEELGEAVEIHGDRMYAFPAP